MCFRDRGNCVVPLATVANAEKSKPQQREHKHGYEENHHRDQDRCRQEDFGKETGYQEDDREEARHEEGSSETSRQEKDQPDRRGPDGFEEKPQTDVLQRNGRSDGEGEALGFPRRQDA
ncbi:hypothetical protein CA13_62410 [Planctomycetes bacterium CA13]|uniref:Uncharacterized protein n=1 Tax=Novipirellula herctigrandis TaxID=2527986 RepID=A0A5C5ZD68_9BACT|nr:hypothetical protein CA13_62410 [Planctomycetes bacterium CA13]